MKTHIRNLNFNTEDFSDKNNNYNMSSLDDINLEISYNQNPKEDIFQDIVDNFINRKLLKENEHKYQIEQTKKSILEKFYSISNNDYLNQQNKNKMHEVECNFNQQNKIIPNNQNQKEYNEIKEKYKNERNKKKSSIFKSEDLHISNTDIVHIKKDDYSPINPNMVDIENKNNIIIIQKKLFGDENIEEGDDINPVEKIEDIDEIELDFSEINNNKYEESEIVCSNYKTKNIESEINTESKNNEYIYNNIFSNDILVKKREVDLCYITNNYNKMKKNLKINKYLKQKQKSKNYSVQLVSSVGYLKNNLNNNNINNGKRENNSFINNINNFNYEKNQNNYRINNQMNLNYLRNNSNCNLNFISDYNNLNGKSFNNKDNLDNDNSNNTIVQINNNSNNYNGIYFTYDNKKVNGSNINYEEHLNQENKYPNKEFQTINNKHSKKNNAVSYYYKNFSNKFSQKNDNKLNQDNIIALEKKLRKPKLIKKKNNSFILNRDINALNNKIFNHQVYKIIKNQNIKSNKENNTTFHIKKNLLNYSNIVNCDNMNNNKIIPVISKMPISLKVKKNTLSKMALKNPSKENLKRIGNKISLINTLLNNNLILFQKNNHQKEAIEKLKSRSNNGVYFIYVDKINEGYSFKGIYKRGASEVNHICNKIFGIPNTPLMLSYEKFYILVENDNKNFEFKKLRDINVLSFIKTILIIKNK